MILNDSKILVTGGAGYIGSHTILELLQAGITDIISADNFSNSTPDTFERIKKITGVSIRNQVSDLCDPVAVERIFKEEGDIRAVIHFAAFKSVPDSILDPERYISNNLGSLKNIIHACKKYSVKKLIFSSSCSVYGDLEKLPVNELTPLGKPESPYAFTKLEGEKQCEQFTAADPETSCVILRYFNPAGGYRDGLLGESPINTPQNLVPAITQTAIGKIEELVVYGSDYDTRDGTCIRDYVHVSDIARAHVSALDFLDKNTRSKNSFLFNLGTGTGVSVLEAIHSFEKVSGKKLRYRIGQRRAGDVEAIYSDCRLAEKELGWKAELSLDEMMSSAWKWEKNCAAQE